MNQAIYFPSGLIGVVRPMKVREERILTDRNLARGGGQLDALIRACWVEALDLGIYDGKQAADQPLNWDEVLACDRFYALLRVRMATYGSSYVFGVRCDSCRAQIEWEVDLKDLPVRPLPDATKAAFRAGNRLETTLPDAGKKVGFRMLVGKDERKIPQLRKASRDRVLSAMLAYRIVDIEGIEPSQKGAFLEDLTMRDADHLVAEFDRVDGGVETTIQVECPECYAVQDVDLPFGPGFLLPSQEKSRRPAQSISSLG